MNLKKLLLQLKENLLDAEKPYGILGCLLIMGLILLFSQNQKETSSLSPIAKNGGSYAEALPIDTFVPNGFVLVTLQLTNGESIDSMIGNYGMVDLYPANSHDFISGNKNVYEHSDRQTSASPIATHLRIIRAPNNHKLFGVLLPEGSRKLIQLLSDPVFAVIQRPDAISPPAHSTTAPTVTTKKFKIHNPSSSRVIQYGDNL